MSVTEGRLYFVEIETKERLEIMFVPDKLERDRIPAIAPIKIVGRNNDKYHFTGGETVLSFRLDFFSEDENREDVYEKCMWLESLMYNGVGNEPPSRVQLVFGGKMFKKDIWIVERAKAEYSLFHKQQYYLPQQAYVDVVLKLDPKTNLRNHDIRNPFAGFVVNKF